MKAHSQTPMASAGAGQAPEAPTTAPPSKSIKHIIDKLYNAYLEYTRKQVILQALKELLKEYGEEPDVPLDELYLPAMRIACYKIYLEDEKAFEITEYLGLIVNEIELVFLAGTGDVVYKYVGGEEITDKRMPASIVPIVKILEKVGRIRIFDKSTDDVENYDVTAVIEEKTIDDIKTVVAIIINKQIYRRVYDYDDP